MSKVVKRKFTPAEDEALRQFVLIYSTDWKTISAHMHDRSPRQCRERWEYYLDPTLKKSIWTPEEDGLLRNLHSEYGPKWTVIARHFDGRTDAMIKNRFQVLRRKDAKVKLIQDYYQAGEKTADPENFKEQNQTVNRIQPIIFWRDPFSDLPSEWNPEIIEKYSQIYITDNVFL